MSQKLAEGEYEAGGRRVLRGIGGMLQDVECVEEDPHRVWWIGEAAVSEGVGGKQVAEFVVNDGYGNRWQWQKSEAQKNCRQSDGEYGCEFVRGEACEAILDWGEPTFAEIRLVPAESQQERDS
jgi:hypothetical protein